jgi:hypothetical protein
MNKQIMVIALVLVTFVVGFIGYEKYERIVFQSKVLTGDTYDIVIDKLGQEPIKVFLAGKDDLTFNYFVEQGYYFAQRGRIIKQPDVPVDYVGEELYMDDGEVASRPLPAVESQALLFDMTEENGDREILLLYFEKKTGNVSEIFVGFDAL